MNHFKIKNFFFNNYNRKETKIIAKEIFFDEIYLLNSLTEPLLIIDAGAHIGLASVWFRSQYPNAHIIAIEPNWMTYELLKENIEINQINNIELINVALGKNKGSRELFFEEGDDGWNSIASFNKGGWRGDRDQSSIKVRVNTLSEIIDRLSIPIDILKLDIEGAEQSVLFEVQKHLNIIRNIIIEFHPVKGNSLKKITKYLRNNGFKVEIINDNDKLAQFGDANLAMIYASKSTHQV
jgi:FkbM family methyltransferase